jgi:hypothetical protein
LTGLNLQQLGDPGLESLANPSGKSPSPDSGGSNSGNKGAPSGDSSAPPTPVDPQFDPARDPDLAAVIAAWPKMPEAIKRVVLAMVEGERYGYPFSPARDRMS